MPDKDINIHIRARDTEQTKREVKDVASSLYDYYKEMGAAGNQVEESTKKASNGFLGLGRIVDNVKNQVTGFVLGWLSIQGVMRLLDMFNQKMERMLQLSKEFYDKSLQIQQIGQGLEFQTGTAGQQKQWGMKALEVQKAGGFADIGTAGQLMHAVEATYKKEGGLKNEQIFSFLKNIAPLIGAAQLNQQGIESLFRIAEQAKIPAQADAFKGLIAKMLAGAAGGKMTLDEFLANTGTGTGFINYLAGGGSLDKAISLYSAAGNVSANKRTGNSLLDLLTQISAGQNEEARKAVERFSGSRLADMNMDQRADTVLRYINSLPESRRVQILQKKGFPSAADLAKLATPSAQQTLETARQAVSQASAENIEPAIKAYTESAAYQEEAIKTEIAMRKAQVSPQEEAWQRQLTKATGQFEILQQKGRDRLLIRDKLEPLVMALENQAAEAEQFMNSLPEGSQQQKEAKTLHDSIETMIDMYTGPLEQYMPPTKRVLYNTGVLSEKKLMDLKNNEINQPVTIVNDNSVNYYPTVGAVDPNRMTSED